MSGLANSATPVDGFRPVRVMEVELGEALPAVSALDPETGMGYERALELVRLHTQPLGVAWLSFGEEGLTPEEHAHQIWEALGPQILSHLQEDGLELVRGLDASGLPGVESPACLEQRRRVLADAPFVSVVVPTHDRPERIEMGLASLTSLEYPRYEVILVDNAPSTEEGAEAVRRLCSEVDRAHYVREDRPGASWARNRGLIESKGEIVAFADDDVRVDRYWLAELVKAFYLEENVGCVTGNVLPMRLDTPAQFWIEQRGGFSKGFTRRVFDLTEHRINHAFYPYIAAACGTGASMAFRTSVLREVGGFDPTLDPASPGRGGEDIAAFFDVILQGRKVIYEPAAIVQHPHYGDYEGLRKQMHAWGIAWGAYLTRNLVTHPDLLPDFALRLPVVVRAMARSLWLAFWGRKDRAELDGSYEYPHGRQLWRVENAAFFRGPVAYAQSIQHVRQLKKRFGALLVAEIPRATVNSSPKAPYQEMD